MCSCDMWLLCEWVCVWVCALHNVSFHLFFVYTFFLVVFPCVSPTHVDYVRSFKRFFSLFLLFAIHVNSIFILSKTIIRLGNGDLHTDRLFVTFFSFTFCACISSISSTSHLLPRTRIYFILFVHVFFYSNFRSLVFFFHFLDC